jgi:hypothetical protein
MKNIKNIYFVYEKIFTQMFNENEINQLFISNMYNCKVMKILLMDQRVILINNDVLKWSCKNGHLEIFNLMKKREIDYLSFDKNCLLKTACKYNKPDIIKVLLEDSRLDKGKDIGSVLKISACNDNVNEEVLFQLVDDNEINIFMCDFPLFGVSCKNGFLKVAKRLLEKGSEPDEYNNCAIKGACENNHIKVVKFLLNLSNIDPGVDYNYTLRIACVNKSIGIIKLLLKDERVDPGVDDNRLIEGIYFNCQFDKSFIDVMKLLLGDIRIYLSMNNREKNYWFLENYSIAMNIMKKNNIRFNVNNNCLIKQASEYGYLKIVKELLKDNMVNPSDDKNYSIRMASCNGHLDVVKELMKDKRVDPSDDKNYAIRWASYNGHLNVIKELLKDKRVDPSDYNNHAIKVAGENNFIEVVKFLKNLRGVDIMTNDNYIIKYCCELGHLELFKELFKDEKIVSNVDVDELLYLSSKHGYINIVNLILKKFRINIDLSLLKYAIDNDYPDLIESLTNEKGFTYNERDIKEIVNKNRITIAKIIFKKYNHKIDHKIVIEWISKMYHKELMILMIKMDNKNYVKIIKNLKKYNANNDIIHKIIRKNELLVNENKNLIKYFCKYDLSTDIQYILDNTKTFLNYEEIVDLLYIGCENNSYNTVKLLLNLQKIDLNIDNYYLIKWSAFNSYKDIIDILFKNEKYKGFIYEEISLKIKIVIDKYQNDKNNLMCIINVIVQDMKEKNH